LQINLYKDTKYKNFINAYMSNWKAHVKQTVNERAAYELSEASKQNYCSRRRKSFSERGGGSVRYYNIP
jgi:hypothetical protein